MVVKDVFLVAAQDGTNSTQDAPSLDTNAQRDSNALLKSTQGRPFDEFRAECRAALAAAIVEPIDLIFSVPKQREFGDLACNAAFLLAKPRRKAPQAIAQEIVAAITQQEYHFIGRVQAISGYVNFSLNEAAFFTDVLSTVLDESAHFGHLQPVAPHNVVIEHTSVNPNKAWHVGHARNAILGDVLGRVFRAAGHHVEIQNYIDDTGKQVADMIYSLRHFGHLDATGAFAVPPSQKLDHFFGEMYVDLYRILGQETSLQAELAVLDDVGDWSAEQVSERRDVLENALRDAREKRAPDRQIAALELQVRAWDAVALLEPAHRDTRAGEIRLTLEDITAMKQAATEVQHDLETGRYRQLVHACVYSQLATAWRLGIYYDLLTWESDIVQAHLLTEALRRIQESPRVYLATEGKLAGCLVMAMGNDLDAESDGAAPPVGTGEDEEHTVDKVLVRSNGIPTYTGKDVAYHFWKYGLLSGDMLYRQDSVQPNGQQLWTSAPDGQPRARLAVTDVINVIAVHQAYPQHVVATALKVTGHQAQYEGFHHLAYGMVNVIIDGVMQNQSGRRGTGLLTDDVLETAVATAYERVLEKRGDDLSDDELRAIAETVATGALRYVMCQYNPLKDIAFDIRSVVNFEGNTGPYLQYSYVRTQAILRKARADKGLSPQEWRNGKATALVAPAERDLIIIVSRLPEIVETVTNNLAINLLADYCFELATAFSQFYKDCKVLTAETPDLLRARLLLVEATAQVMRVAYGLLGLGLVERL